MRGAILRSGIGLSLFWLLYFGGQGIFFPYYALYLNENAGLDGARVGLVLAVLPLTGIFAQSLWGQIADRTGARTRLLAALTAAAGCGYALLATGGSFAALLWLTALLSVFATAVVPLGTSVSLALLGKRGSETFGFVRVWGTFGFLLLVVGFPRLLEQIQQRWDMRQIDGAAGEPALAVMFPATAILVLLAALVAAALPARQEVSQRAERGDWKRLLRHRPLRRLLFFSLCAYCCLQGPMLLFPTYVRGLGGDMHTVGRMWVFMLLVEIPLVALSGRGLRRLGPRGLLATGVLAAGVRWVACAATDQLWILYPVQMLHGVVVAGLMIGAPLYLEAVVPLQLRSTGQGLLATAGAGVGAILSNVLAGWLLAHFGPDAPYLAGGLGALALGCAIPWILPAPTRQSLASPAPGINPSLEGSIPGP